MRIPKSEFTDADLALCRAHGDAVGALVKASDVREPSASDYNLGLAVWLMGLSDSRRGADKTLAPAKPAAQQQEPTIKVGDAVMTTYDGVATVVSLGHGEVMGDIATVRLANGYEGCTSVAGLKRIPHDATNAAQGSALIGVKQPAAEPTHYVCIREHVSAHCKIGDIIPAHRSGGPSSLLMACDSHGWIPHTPTPDAVCPVPDGVRFEALYGDGTPVESTEITRHDCMILWRSGSPENTIVAWRPIAKDAS